MKYCVSARQPKNILQQADEIRLDYRDNGILVDFIEDYPDKTIVIAVPSSVEQPDKIPWSVWGLYNQEKIKIKIALQNINMRDRCIENELLYFWDYPATTWQEIRALQNIGVCEMFISGPLMFEMDKLEKEEIKCRAWPNIAYNAYLPLKHGICGGYIRPEDIELYEPAIQTFEFMADELDKEATLFDVYKNKGIWNGNLNLLITNLNYNVDNRGLPDDFGEVRRDCKQKCMENLNGCHFCESAFKLCRMIDKMKDEWVSGKGFV